MDNDSILDQYGYEVAERAAIIEFEARMPKDVAEKLAVKYFEEHHEPATQPS